MERNFDAPALLFSGGAPITYRSLHKQMQEITAMKLAIGEPATDTTPAPTQPPSAPNTTVHHHPGMQMDMSTGMKK